MPSSVAARSAPIAMLSLEAKIAVGGLVDREEPARRPVAALDLEVAGDDELARREDACPCERGLIPVHPLLGRDPPLPSGDHPDSSMPELEEVVGRRARAGPVGGGHDGDALVEGHRGIDDDEREPLGGELAELGVRLGRQHEDGAVGRTAQETLDEQGLPIVFVPRRA